MGLTGPDIPHIMLKMDNEKRCKKGGDRMNPVILIAEDEKDLNRIISSRLAEEHYSVDSCYDGEEALEYLESAGYDAVVLDIMMPKTDGLTVLKKMRRNNDATPVLLLTARDSIEDRVKGLDAGANDYLVKPFAFEELLARIRVMLRKPDQSGEGNCLTVGDLTLDTGSHTARRGDRVIDLSAREYAILEYLCMNPEVGGAPSRVRV